MQERLLRRVYFEGVDSLAAFSTSCLMSMSSPWALSVDDLTEPFPLALSCLMVRGRRELRCYFKQNKMPSEPETAGNGTSTTSMPYSRDEKHENPACCVHEYTPKSMSTFWSNSNCPSHQTLHMVFINLNPLLWRLMS